MSEREFTICLSVIGSVLVGWIAVVVWCVVS